MMEEAASGEHGDVFFTGINQLRITVFFRRRRAERQQAIFRMQKDVSIVRQVAGNFSRQANAQIDVSAIWNVLCYTLSNLVTGQFDIAHESSLLSCNYCAG